MNYQRIYEFRFKGVDPQAKLKVWKEISTFIYQLMGRPTTVLEPAAGAGEFILSIPAQKRWAVDMVPQEWFKNEPSIKCLVSDIFNADLPDNYFEAVYISNFLEHLSSQQQISLFMERIYKAMKPGGRFVVMGPNFKYCFKEYFDCADHVVPLTHVAVAEHLYAAGFELDLVKGRFLPYSFRGLLPPSALLTRLYLKMPIFWPLLGKQFLLVGVKK
jgi:SAM-dependent methyltransferase